MVYPNLYLDKHITIYPYIGIDHIRIHKYICMYIHGLIDIRIRLYRGMQIYWMVLRSECCPSVPSLTSLPAFDRSSRIVRSNRILFGLFCGKSKSQLFPNSECWNIPPNNFLVSDLVLYPIPSVSGFTFAIGLPSMGSLTAF